MASAAAAKESEPRQSEWKTSNLDKYSTILFDCDGVLWRGGTAIEGVKGTLHKLSKLGKRMLFVSNNSGKLSEAYVRRIKELFDFEVNEDQIWTSGTATVAQLQRMEITGKVFLVGSESMNTRLTRQGFTVIWSNQLKREHPDCHPGEMELDSEVQCVVVAFDLHYGYFDVSMATRYLRMHLEKAAKGSEISLSSDISKPVSFVASNDDASFPFSQGIQTAGTGSLVAAVEKTVPFIKPIVCGKPHSVLFELISEHYGREEVNPSNCLMIGDRLNTDVYFANEQSMDSVLVLTGITSEEESKSIAIPEQRPTFVLPSVNDLLSASEVTTSEE